MEAYASSAYTIVVEYWEMCNQQPGVVVQQSEQGKLSSNTMFTFGPLN
jgi:ornithine cyclodeaminase/alanine dehydrogenase-like protein (mu-crystallin family)